MKVALMRTCFAVRCLDEDSSTWATRQLPTSICHRNGSQSTVRVGIWIMCFQTLRTSLTNPLVPGELVIALVSSALLLHVLLANSGCRSLLDSVIATVATTGIF